ncbi:MAG: L-histidine N(alpha)-methyltransferase [Proteobacteria bacterium]|nr:L-histidine N(alpha)-methyltransferase [Pseudomonadota bacterium]
MNQAVAVSTNLLPSTDDEGEIDPERFHLTTHLESIPINTLAQDVLSGFAQAPKSIPSKYFYDQRGAELFDAICGTEEYYQTRTEKALLERVAGDIVTDTRPTDLVELGSGAGHKTRVLLDHLTDRVADPRYVSVDISEQMLISSAGSLLRDYPNLTVHGVIADYDHHLHLLPDGVRRLIAFLGSTLGNFTHLEAIAFLADIARGMKPGDRVLLGLDLVKSPAVLHAAYNDAEGVTAEFNRNVLHVINRELGADFEPANFEHIARYSPGRERIEMSLRARHNHVVRIGELALDVPFGDGEHLHTEISRKFTRASAIAMIRAAGLELANWYVAENDYFALAVVALPGDRSLG